MCAELALVDTNVLVYSIYEDSEYHEASRRLLNRAQDGEISLCIAAQNLAEFYAVITDKKRVTNPFQPDEAAAEVNKLLAMDGVTLLPTPPDVVQRWLELAHQQKVTGGKVFDLQLAAILLGNGVSRIYTYNRPDFEMVDTIEVLTP